MRILLAVMPFALAAADDIAPPPPASKAALPHVLLVLADDLGYGNVGWLREQNKCPTREVQTPVLDGLVKNGIQLSRFYVFHAW
jgi:arylsulfatase A-like enzyme